VVHNINNTASVIDPSFDEHGAGASRSLPKYPVTEEFTAASTDGKVIIVVGIKYERQVWEIGILNEALEFCYQGSNIGNII
jgi:hypothetical protein